MADSAAPTLVNNIARGNRHAEGYGSGIVFAEAAGGVARRNQVYDNDWGIAIGPDAQPRLADNDVHDNTRDHLRGRPGRLNARRQRGGPPQPARPAIMVV